MSDATPTPDPGAQPVPAAATGALTPQRPKGVDDTVHAELEQQAAELASQAASNPTDRQLTRRMQAIGVKEQQKASKEISLLKTRVGTLLNNLDNEGGEIPKTLIDLRHTMDEINPNVIGKPGGFSRLLGRTPGVGKILRRISAKYESVQTQIDSIMDGLRSGKDKLLQDNAELDQLYIEVQEAQNGIQKSAYMGEILSGKLEEQSLTLTDPNEKRKLNEMQHKVAMRVQDLRTMEQVNLQFFASIDMTVQNNDTLAEQIDRTVMVTQNLLTVGLAIQAALANQKQVADAVQQVQASTAAMLEANASAIGAQTAQIGQMQNNPVIALESVKNAYNSLVSAMDQMDEVKRIGTAKAKAGIEELNQMSAALQPKVEALEAAADLPALEAGQPEKKEEPEG